MHTTCTPHVYTFRAEGMFEGIVCVTGYDVLDVLQGTSQVCWRMHEYTVGMQARRSSMWLM